MGFFFFTCTWSFYFSFHIFVSQKIKIQFLSSSFIFPPPLLFPSINSTLLFPSSPSFSLCFCVLSLSCLFPLDAHYCQLCRRLAVTRSCLQHVCVCGNSRGPYSGLLVLVTVCVKAVQCFSNRSSTQTEVHEVFQPRQLCCFKDGDVGLTLWSRVIFC